MNQQTALGITTFAQLRKLAELKASGDIQFGGNKKLKIYGLLSCSSGKRMKAINRVFFKSTTEAVNLGYRPCAHCLPVAYKNWKNGLV